MIFVTVGSQKFQFNRLLRELDVLVEKNSIKENIFAQTGYSDYKPKNYRFKNFLDRDEFKEIMEMSNKVITHGGTGAIVNAVKQGKKVIAIPRLKEYGEHVDNHQLQIIGEFEKMQFINVVKEIDELENVIENIENHDLKDYISNTDAIIESIDDFIR
ncbi:beta(1,3)galactosyltransferase EpsH [Clostridium chromiireducens]|uniref:Beta(1,3)galactosyltransferase EpsH n=1 Tax=Clostridium chromiireducens TaxID=225345 RepID=A0A399ISG2_9CLOT|nr:PssE/Cps14G family polysaccharide biosynthesis glycosyltransferase [Clostridium chromiireducens]MVX63215.1 beta(1,3)galactosyltransferase EpsH [Clostridium chromiireducens]RII33886.1 beta(1,3)galactosyltransferase EpsH [Clostridium chromiireducens]